MIAVVVEAAVKSALLAFVLLTATAYTVLLERKLLGRFQVRYGPNRVGPAGLLQPLADGIKLLTKESFVPQGADRLVYLLSPVLITVTALFVYAVIPFGPPFEVFGYRVTPYVADPNVGILLVLGASSVGVYGLILGGWSSNSKYSLLGGLRSSAQVISYELSLALAVVGVVLAAGSLSLVRIVEAQQEGWFVVRQPVAFVIFFLSALAETNRAPFDLPEAEQELIAGYQTEYGGFKFGMFYIAEYLAIITQSALAATLFFGGWMGPWLPGIVWFAIKVTVFVMVFIWIRATVPRVRYDQLMGLGWKILIPVALGNVVVTALFVV
ncbi:MAG: NADH-quinone oxidoreductase subunit NuoH [Armatimonadota bacterium]|nr:NADH-quinone oxidoreductase subunit NuoH [Armatimonadota bacterium]MDR5697036.1 NADH-quinone oxidoreductase subunit NuoH [Armatimonadota bacterium]